VHLWVIRWLVVMTTMMVVGLMPNAASSQDGLADPGLDDIMRATPAGYQRAERDRLPEGPMTAGTFNRIGATAVPVRADNAVVYGASYERPDGSIIIFLGMSTSSREDGQAFADRVIEGSLTNARAFEVGTDDVVGVEGESNGSRAAAIAFARNGRGFAVLSFGERARDDASDFAGLVVLVAESTPIRSDVRPTDQLPPTAVAFAALVAVALCAVVVLWRFVRRRANRPRRDEPADTDTLEHPVPAPSPRPSPRPTPR
jgi:hypothetical protein